jgi:hypothetical protein
MWWQQHKIWKNMEITVISIRATPNDKLLGCQTCQDGRMSSKRRSPNDKNRERATTECVATGLWRGSGGGGGDGNPIKVTFFTRAISKTVVVKYSHDAHAAIQNQVLECDTPLTRTHTHIRAKKESKFDYNTDTRTHTDPLRSANV